MDIEILENLKTSIKDRYYDSRYYAGVVSTITGDQTHYFQIIPDKNYLIGVKAGKGHNNLVIYSITAPDKDLSLWKSRYEEVPMATDLTVHNNGHVLYVTPLNDNRYRITSKGTSTPNLSSADMDADGLFDIINEGFIDQ